MKICMLSNADVSYPYGSTTRPHYLAKHLARHGFEILHICKKRSSDEDNIRYLSIEEHSEKSNREIFGIIHGRCKQFTPDIIYTHQVYTAKIALKLKYLLNKPHLYDPHGSVALENTLHTQQSFKRRTWLSITERVILKLTNKIIVPSRELKDFLIERYRLPVGKISVIKNGVETATFKPQPPDMVLRDALGIPREAIVIVFTNPRVFPSNEIALRYFFKIIPEIERNCPKAIFLVLGGGPELKTPSKKVIYTGLIENLPSYVNLADVCVAPFPSHAICGGTRNKICEYMACGKPIVSTKEGMRGFDDAVDGEHFLLAKNDEDFVSKFIYCINNTEKAKQIGEKARKLSMKYDWGRLSRELAGVFLGELNKGGYIRRKNR
jgi:glycosyltransferase involved in cell wall biosynthesis